MKVGDLIKMKPEMWWKVRSRTKDYHKGYGIVYDIAGRGLKVLMPDNTIRASLSYQWQIVNKINEDNNESRQ
tara:strand:+ start:134 stop:349 length:216 start_codon:yes stop_codon:yes gene_type:complete